ncbi:hypothetical protein JCGZ_09122 [Jatropha curcas]|uniref:RNase H type-1 domain-containing protein n=1 Tax=Jatropha curcas TaxID=180498 RepID=A0A067KV25_JATCU|nr:hypothetical protein JCGZ_09122 [Jatropha curcas]
MLYLWLVFPSSDEQWILGFAAPLSTCTALEAELWSVFYALSLAREKCWVKLQLQVDSHALVDMLSNR